MHVDLGAGRLRAIDYEYMSYSEIDDLQSQEIFKLITDWKNGSLQPYEIFHKLSNICCFNLYSIPTISDEPPKEVIKPVLEEEDPALVEEANRYFNKRFRTEVLDPKFKSKITDALNDIEQRLSNVEISFWGAGLAMAEILLAQLPSEKKDYFDYSEAEESIVDFHRQLKKQEQYWRDRDDRKNIDIRDSMKPDSESEIKANADACLGAIKGGGKGEFMWRYKGVDDMSDFDTKLNPPSPTDLFSGGDDKIWGEWGKDSALCDEIYIDPSGTGLISIDVLNDGTHDFYGVKIARITTYSVSLKANSPEHAEQLSRIVEVALSAIKTYEPTREFSGGQYFEDYQTPNPYIKEKDGIITIVDRFSLDDLWTFYYMIEPVLKLNSQIATAMDMARYAEERGAPLDPDAIYLSNQEHDVAPDVHVLEDGEHALSNSLRDTFYDVAIGRINHGQFLNRLSILADHSLQGQIHDPNQLLLSYNKMIEDQSADPTIKGDIITYEAAMKDRVYDLIRVLTGNYGDETPLALSLTQTLNHYSPLLKAQAKQEQIEREKRDWLKVKEEDTSDVSKGSMLDSIADSPFDTGNLSDAFDKLRGYKKCGMDTLQYEDGEDYEATTDLVEDKPTQLVVHGSAVETCLDEMHYLGQTGDPFDDEPDTHHYYRSRTKGSMYPRKTLPTKLKPFSRNDSRKEFNALEFKPF